VLDDEQSRCRVGAVLHVLLVVWVGALIGFRTRRRRVLVWLFAVAFVVVALSGVWERQIRGGGALVMVADLIVPFSLSALACATLRSWSFRWRNQAARKSPSSN
jgi:ABC-type proline/glycine betaine transport system permease subunit